MSDGLKNLIAGNKRFRKKYFNKEKALFNELVSSGQRPKTMMVACSDSRIDPAIIFDSKPGELFVIRNVANLIPPCELDNNSSHGTSAALEFGTRFLHVEQIILLGHSNCGGIQALLENADSLWQKKPDSFIGQWMETARPAYDQVLRQNNALTQQEKLRLLERYALIHSLKNLHTFPWIEQRVNKKTLAVYVLYFDLATGLLKLYDQKSNVWISLEK